MAIDRKKMKEQLLNRTKKSANRRNRSGAGIFKDDIGDVNFWSPKEGDHIIDIIPYEAGSNDPTTSPGEQTYCFEYLVHPKVGPTENQKVICLEETFGQTCPICQHRIALMNEGQNKEVWKPLFPKPRNIYNIVCDDSPKELQRGVQIWDVSNFYFEKHLTKIAKGPVARGGNRGGPAEIKIPFAHPDEGKSISFSIETTGKEFPEYSSHQFVDRDYVIEDEILKAAHCFDEMVHIPTYEEVYELYWGEAPEGDSSSTEEPPEPGETPSGRGGRRSSPPAEDKPATRSRRTKTEAKENPPEDDKVEEDSDDGENADTGEEVECPVGGSFGDDFNEYEECDNCPVWDKCQIAKEGGAEQEPEPETEPEVKKPPVRRGAAKKPAAPAAPSRRRR